MSTERELAREPIIAAAIAAHDMGSDPGWIFQGGSDQLILHASTGLPRVSIREGCALIRWWTNGRTAVHYEAVCDGLPPRMTLSDTDMAESMVISLIGRPLRDVIEIEGDPGYVIVNAGTQRLGEFPSLWIRLAMSHQ